jgi:hypothetical protein
MDIFCEKCQEKVGQIADEKIPVGKKVSVSCPKCGDKIYFARPAEMSGVAAPPQPTAPAPARKETPPGANSAPPVAAGNPAGYDFAIMDVIREAWDKTSGVKGTLWGGFIVMFLIVTALSVVMGLLVAFSGGGSAAAALSMAMQITVTVAMYPLMTGVIMIGIRRAVDLPVDYKMVFGYFGYLLPIIISAVLTSIMTTIGFLLLIIPGIYLSLAYVMVWPLIVERDMTPWKAMETSRKAIHRKWFKVFGLYFVTGLIVSISAIPFGIGLIWTMPMAVMVTGILYRDIFGVSAKA